jgi:hypothetical protein
VLFLKALLGEKMKKTEHVEFIKIRNIIRQSLSDNFDWSEIRDRQEVQVADDLDIFYRQRLQQYQHLTEQLDTLSVELKYRFSEFQSLDATLVERKSAEKLLQQLVMDVFITPIHTLDFTLELYNRRHLVNKDENEGIYFYLISIAGWNDGIVRDNHNIGYHFHHVDTKKKPVRTRVLLTFNPDEKIGPPDSLHWEYHGNKYKTAYPLRWSPRRCVAIHTATCPSLQNPGKNEFRPPSKNAQVLCSR